MWIFFAGAIFLPYFAVVIANAVGSSRSNGVAGAIAPTRVLNLGNYDRSTTDK